MGNSRRPEPPTARILGPALYIARRRLNLKQIDLALSLGMDPSTLCLYEHGKRCPSVPMLIKLADALCVSIDELLGRQEFCANSKTGSRPT